LPGLVPIAQTLGIDFAPAMVGFEVRKGRTFPVYDGIVICDEFKDLILDAQMAKEEARLSELLRKKEESDARKQRHLLRSMATRQRLETAYEGTNAGTSEPEHGETIASSISLPMAEAIRSASDGAQPLDSKSNFSKKKGAQKQGQCMQSPHVHQFPEENQSYDEDTGIRTKRCACGFTYFVEEM
jgi:xeroderma pigmentosum group C-complementing protein